MGMYLWVEFPSQIMIWGEGYSLDKPKCVVRFPRISGRLPVPSQELLEFCFPPFSETQNKGWIDEAEMKKNETIRQIGLGKH